MPIVSACQGGDPGAVVEPSSPDFSAQAPNGYVIGSNISIEYYVFDEPANEKDFSTPFTAKLVSFDSMNAKDGITLFENHVFSKESYSMPMGFKRWILSTKWPIPNHTLKELNPSYNALKLVMWNVSEAEMDHNTTNLYHFSPGIYISDPNEGASSAEPSTTP
jgi:hypothetical protein